MQEKNPWDVTRHIRLLRQYVTVGAVSEAYTRITMLSPSVRCSFATNLDWNRCICDVFKVRWERVKVKYKVRAVSCHHIGGPLGCAGTHYITQNTDTKWLVIQGQKAVAVVVTISWFEIGHCLLYNKPVLVPKRNVDRPSRSPLWAASTFNLYCRACDKSRDVAGSFCSYGLLFNHLFVPCSH